MGAHQIVRQPALGIETPSRTERCLWRLGSGLDSAGLITHRTKVQSPPRDQAKSLDYDFHWVSNPTVRTGVFRWPGQTRGPQSSAVCFRRLSPFGTSLRPLGRTEAAAPDCPPGP